MDNDDVLKQFLEMSTFNKLNFNHNYNKQLNEIESFVLDQYQNAK